MREQQHVVTDRLGNVVVVIQGDQILDPEGSVLARVTALGDGFKVEPFPRTALGFVIDDRVIEVTGFSRDEVFGGDFIGGYGGPVVGNLRQAAARFPDAAADDRISTAMLLALYFVSVRVYPDILAKERAHAAAQQLADLSDKERSELGRLLGGNDPSDVAAPSNRRGSRSPIGVAYSKRTSRRPPMNAAAARPPTIGSQPMQTTDNPAPRPQRGSSSAVAAGTTMRRRRR